METTQEDWDKPVSGETTGGHVCFYYTQKQRKQQQKACVSLKTMETSLCDYVYNTLELKLFHRCVSVKETLGRSQEKMSVWRRNPHVGKIFTNLFNHENKIE